MKKRLQFVLLLILVLCVFTACRGGGQTMTTAPAATATTAATQATTMPTTQPETTMDNGNGPLDTNPQGDETQDETLETNGTNQAQR